MEQLIIPDTAIIAVNRGKQENVSNNIVYRDKNGQLHSIDFDVCATNFKTEHASSSGNCIGERKIDEYKPTFVIFELFSYGILLSANLVYFSLPTYTSITGSTLSKVP